MSAQDIIKNWMDRCCTTIKNYDHKGHMDLISEKVQVYGIPGFEVIGYDDWFSQCEHEFSQKVIQSARYEGLKIKHDDDTKVMFSTMEIINATDGSEEKHGIEVVLFKEEDGQWRVIQERLIDNDEARHEGLPV